MGKPIKNENNAWKLVFIGYAGLLNENHPEVFQTN